MVSTQISKRAVWVGTVLACICVLLLLARFEPIIQREWLAPLANREAVFGTPRRLEILLMLGVDPNAGTRVSPLQSAITARRLDSVRSLLQAGADPNAPTEWDYPLCLAYGMSELEIAEALLKAGADPRLVKTPRMPVWELAAVCKNPMSVPMLVAAGLDPDSTDLRTGGTWLMSAVMANNPSAVRELRRYGADVTRRDCDGLTASDYARQSKRTEIIELLAR